MMRRYDVGSWHQETGRRGEKGEDIVGGENVNTMLERWCRWMDLITIGLRAEAPGVC